ncbi:MAG: prolipoprotein diacylglyceryl transferase [Acholeplasmataceae bacterium]|nr:prolipoprotein diacylglyceryl transferase [Acholeplasmataceae bacterium]
MKTNKKWTDHPLFIYGGPLLVFFLMVTIAVGTQSGVPYKSIAIDLGFAQIAWYAVFILTGIILGAFLTYQEFKKFNWDVNILYDGILYAVPLAILGARLYYVVFDPSPNYESFIDVINITQGGLAIHGAVLVTLIFMIFFTKKKKISFWAMADMIMIGFLIGQIVGRWGNFMNQEAYGPVIESQFILNILPTFILDQMFIDGAFHHPTFLYEGLWNFAGLVFLLIARRKRWFKVGDMLGLYLIWYGLGRGLIIEPLRVGGHPDDALRLFGLPANIVLSLGLFMLGGILLLIVNRFVIKDQPYYADMLVKGNEND